MNTLRQAAQQTLEALENHTAIKHPQQIHYRDAAIDALRAALAEQVQEPVFDCPRCGHCCPQRKPLTEEEIDNAVCHLGFAQLSPREVARAIEQVHGIKGEA